MNNLQCCDSGKEKRMSAGMRTVSVAAVIAGAYVGRAGAAEATLQNPTGSAYRQALVRLPTEPPKGRFTVRSGGAQIPYQVETIDGRPWVWVCSDFAPRSTNRYEFAAGEPAASKPLVSVRRDGTDVVLDNGVVAVKVPAGQAAGELRGPIAALRTPDGKWVGRSAWKTAFKSAKLACDVTGDGTLFGKVRLRYAFDGRAGPAGDAPAFAEFDVRLGPGWRHVEIEERHEMADDDRWEFEASHGWTPKEGRSKPFSAGPGSGSVLSVPAHDRPLAPGGLPNQRPDVFINLLPRWNQHYKDGWFFAASDGAQAVGVMPVRAGRWLWPHDNALEIIVNDTGAYAGVRCPARHGARLWWLLAGPSDSPAGRADLDYFMRYGFEDLDKINRDFILGWDGRAGGWFSMNPYSGDQINPTGVMRGLRKGLLPRAGRPGNLSTLYQAQVYLHDDTYGSYWKFWSPENANFFTDYIHVPLLLVTQLKDHPRFEELRRMAEMRVREDVHHSFTLPGGAGQECPGYMAGAWNDPEGICRTHLGFDPAQWDRMKARASFKARITQPDGAVRRTLPMGDTHPGPDGPKVEDVPVATVARFAAEELPGFGVIFNGRPGTPRETYLSFKSGPNRGHYHGDQLAVHLCLNARPAAVDHHCSYHPRAGQDHMHNRLAFFTASEPYLNMDGYERLIAFRTSPRADMAVGQVESGRLRHANALPPEQWDVRWPVVPLSPPLVYRRTVVFVKGAEGDYVVLRDQFRAPAELGVAYCLHVRDERAMALQCRSGGNGGDTDGSARFTDTEQDFAKLGVGPDWVLDIGPASREHQSPLVERYWVKRAEGGALELDRPAPAGAKQPYTLFRPTHERAEGLVTVGPLALTCVAPRGFALRPFPWRHENGRPETTQGVRLETRGREGEYITVLCAAERAGDVQAIPGGVRAGDCDVVFAGGLDAGPAEALVTVTSGGREVASLAGKDIDLNRSQGDVGLFVPDAGYPFGEIPDWLIRQRLARPAPSNR